MTAGWTTATKSFALISKILFMRSSESDDTAAHGHAAADIAMSGAAWRDGNFILVCEVQDFGN